MGAVMQWLSKFWFWVALALAVGFMALHTLAPVVPRKAEGVGRPQIQSQE